MANYHAKKVGQAFHQQRELEQKYNELETEGVPQRIVDWMNQTLKGEHAECGASTFRRFQFHLRDGTALCKFINKLRTGAGNTAVKYQKIANTPFTAMENIDIFNKTATEYGIDTEDTFPSSDLYEGQKAAFLKIILCLKKLGDIANSKGFQPAYVS